MPRWTSSLEDMLSLGGKEAWAEEILELVDKTEREVSGHDDIVEGTVSAGRGDLANVEVLAELFRGFHARYRNPHISLQQIAAANDQGE